MFRTDQECIVCGKARFLIEGDPWFFSPLTCSKGCADGCADESQLPSLHRMNLYAYPVMDEDGKVRDLDYLSDQGSWDTNFEHPDGELGDEG